MSARYRLPDALGGAECVYHSAGYQPGCWIVELVDVMPGLRLELERSALTEVTPEPPLGSVVLVDADDGAMPPGSVLRRYERGWTDQLGAEYIEYSSWKTVCRGRPVLLAPVVTEVYVVGKGERGEGTLPIAACATKEQAIATACRLTLVDDLAAESPGRWMANIDGCDEVWVYKLSLDGAE